MVKYYWSSIINEGSLIIRSCDYAIPESDVWYLKYLLITNQLYKLNDIGFSFYSSSSKSTIKRRRVINYVTPDRQDYHLMLKYIDDIENENGNSDVSEDFSSHEDSDENEFQLPLCEEINNMVIELSQSIMLSILIFSNNILPYDMIGYIIELWLDIIAIENDVNDISDDLKFLEKFNKDI